MTVPAFKEFPTRRMQLPVPFDVYDPTSKKGSRVRILVDVDIPEDRDGMSPADGIYTIVDCGTNRTVTYYRVGDVGFAPIRDACLRDWAGMLDKAEPQRQLHHLTFDGRYALPTLCNDAFSLSERYHTLTGGRASLTPSHKPWRYNDVTQSGLFVVGWKERAEAIRETASRSFLIRRDVGLCMASIPPVWIVSRPGSFPHVYISLRMISPQRRQDDVFNIRRMDAATEFARTVYEWDPVVEGRVIALPTATAKENDVTAAFAGEHRRFARLLQRWVVDLPEEGVRLWHASIRGGEDLLAYGSPGAMIEVLDRVGEALVTCPEACYRWGLHTRDLRRRLEFETGRAPTKINAERCTL